MTIGEIMTVIAFLIQPPHTYAVYAISGGIGYTEDILADKVVFSLTFDPFRDESLIIIDLSLLPS